MQIRKRSTFTTIRTERAINRSWTQLIGAWENFKATQEKVFEGQPGTIETHER